MLNGGTIVELLHSKKSTTDSHIHGSLMKMRSTISTILMKTKYVQTCFHKSCKKSSLMKIHIFLLITLLICASTITSSAAHTMKYSSNTVKTKYGELRGIVVRNNPTVEAFLGKAVQFTLLNELNFKRNSFLKQFIFII